MAAIEDLATSMAESARAEASAYPQSRGADWRTALVTAVHADGTVSCGDIRARRMEGYILPVVGELAVISRSGSGSWLAHGRLSAAGSATWTPLPLASGIIHPGHGYEAAYMVDGPVVRLRGRAGVAAPGTIANAQTIATVPAGLRPTEVVGWAGPRNSSGSVRLEVLTTGVIRTYESANLPSWVSLDGAIWYLT